MIPHAIRWAPIAALIALTGFSVVFGSLELPDVLIYSESTVALILVACVGQFATACLYSPGPIIHPIIAMKVAGRIGLPISNLR